MQELNDERVLFAFARDLEPALTVASGETVRIRTQDCFGNQVQTPEDELDEINWDRINRQPAPCSWRRGARRRAEGDHREHRARPANRVVHGQGRGVCGDRFDVWSTHCALSTATS